MKSFLFAGLFAVCCFSAQAGTLGLDIVNPEGNAPSQAPDQNLGWEFTTSTQVTVDALGIWDYGSNVLAGAHEVGLWTSTGTLLAQASVDNSSTPVASAATYGRWLFTDIGDVTLDPGDYVVSAVYPSFDSASDFYTYLASVVTDPAITYVAERSNTSGTFSFPGAAGNGLTHAFFGANVLLSDAPEPGTFLLLLPAGLAILARRRRW